MIADSTPPPSRRLSISPKGRWPIDPLMHCAPRPPGLDHGLGQDTNFSIGPCILEKILNRKRILFLYCSPRETGPAKKFDPTAHLCTAPPHIRHIRGLGRKTTSREKPARRPTRAHARALTPGRFLGLGREFFSSTWAGIWSSQSCSFNPIRRLRGIPDRTKPGFGSPVNPSAISLFPHPFSMPQREINDQASTDERCG